MPVSGIFAPLSKRSAMFTVELYAKIRLAVMVDRLSRREAAKRFGVHRNTITKMLSFSVPPGYRRREEG